MWWRRKPSGSDQPRRPPGYGRQIWLRKTHPIEAITGQYGDWEPVVGDEPGRIYDDEIDPSWRDPETSPGPEWRPSKRHPDSQRHPTAGDAPPPGPRDAGNHARRRRGRS